MVLFCTFALSLFHLIVLLILLLIVPRVFLSFSVNKVTPRTYNFVSVILNVAFVGLSIATTARFASGSGSFVALFVNTQFSNHVKIRFI